MFVMEGPGSAAWLEYRPELARKILAAIELDCVGYPRHLGRTPEGLNLSVYGIPSCLDPVTMRVLRGHIHSQRGHYWTWWQTPDFHVRQGGGNDSRMVTVLSRGGAMRVAAANYVWHTSADTMELVCPEALAHVGVLTGTAGLVLAMAGDREAADIARLSLAHALETLARQTQIEVERIQAARTRQKRLLALRDSVKQLDFVVAWQGGIIRSTERLADKAGKARQRRLCARLCGQLANAAARGQRILSDTAGISSASKWPAQRRTVLEKRLRAIIPVFEPPVFKLMRLPGDVRTRINWTHVWALSDFADGKRNLLEIVEMLARSDRKDHEPTRSTKQVAELVSKTIPLERVMRILEEHGYVRLMDSPRAE